MEHRFGTIFLSRYLKCNAESVLTKNGSIKYFQFLKYKQNFIEGKPPTIYKIVSYD